MDQTLSELYTEALEHNIDIFSNIVVPADTDIYTNLVREAILKNGGDMVPIWNNPTILKYQIETWSRSNEFLFRHVDKIMKAEYSPIENTDKYVERTETVEGQDLETRDLQTKLNGTHSNTGTDTNTRSLNTTERTTKGTTSTERNSGSDTTQTQETTTNTISGFNSGSYQPDTKSDVNGSETLLHGHNRSVSETGSDSTANTGTVTDTMQKGSQIVSNDTTKDTGTVKNDKNNKLTIVDHTHGNIGVTTNTQLIESEVALVKKFNAYDLIAEVFLNDMCIAIFN